MNSGSGKKLITFPFILLIFMSPALAVKNKVNDLWTVNGVKLVINEKVTDTWRGVTYDSASDNEAETGRYICILNRELKLYPEGYLKKANVQQIVLGRNMAFRDKYRAAIPDPYKGILYYSTNGACQDSSEEYLVDCIHHELHHMVEFSIWKDFRYDWVRWQKLNIEGFRYGSGGEEAYRDWNTDYYSPVHPEKGFINRYSMTGDEEDRAVVMSYIMSGIVRQKLVELCKEDEILRRKVMLIAELVNEFAGKKFIDITPYMRE